MRFMHLVMIGPVTTQHHVGRQATADGEKKEYKDMFHVL